MSGPLDVAGIRRDYEAAREHLNNNWACCSGHRLGAEVPLLLAEIERLKAASVRETESKPAEASAALPYCYYVAYRWPGGYGANDIWTSDPVDSFADVNRFRDTIVSAKNRIPLAADDIVILNFILLSGPKEVVS